MTLSLADPMDADCDRSVATGMFDLTAGARSEASPAFICVLGVAGVREIIGIDEETDLDGVWKPCVGAKEGAADFVDRTDVGITVDDFVSGFGLGAVGALLMPVIDDLAVDDRGLVAAILDSSRNCSGLAVPENRSILVRTRRIIFSTLSDACGTEGVDAGEAVGLNDEMVSVVDCFFGSLIDESRMTAADGTLISTGFEWFARKKARIESSDERDACLDDPAVDFLTKVALNEAKQRNVRQNVLDRMPYSEIWLVRAWLFNDDDLSLAQISLNSLFVSVNWWLSSCRRLRSRCWSVSSVFKEISNSGRKSLKRSRQTRSNDRRQLRARTHCLSRHCLPRSWSRICHGWSFESIAARHWSYASVDRASIWLNRDVLVSMDRAHDLSRYGADSLFDSIWFDGEPFLFSSSTRYVRCSFSWSSLSIAREGKRIASEYTESIAHVNLVSHGVQVFA